MTFVAGAAILRRVAYFKMLETVTAGGRLLWPSEAISWCNSASVLLALALVEFPYYLIASYQTCYRLLISSTALHAPSSARTLSLPVFAAIPTDNSSPCAPSLFNHGLDLIFAKEQLVGSNLACWQWAFLCCCRASRALIVISIEGN